MAELGLVLVLELESGVLDAELESGFVAPEPSPEGVVLGAVEGGVEPALELPEPMFESGVVLALGSGVVTDGVPLLESGVALESGVLVLEFPVAFCSTALMLSNCTFKASRSLVTVSSWVLRSVFSFLRFSVSTLLHATNIKATKKARISFMPSVYARLEFVIPM